MKYAGYLKHERNIAASDTGGVLERWSYGRRLLEDDTATTPAGNLRHGVLAILIGRARLRGYKIGDREIQRRLQAAKAYPTEAEIRQALTDFTTWDQLLNAGFPPVDAPADEPADAQDGGEQDERLAAPGEQLALFPAEQFTRLSTLGELAKYADEQREYTEHMAARDARRYAYLQLLIAAVGGDMSATWEDAQQALDATP
jgi:hypothetical protein